MTWWFGLGLVRICALAALKAAAAQRLAAGQAELDLGVATRPGAEPLPITSTRTVHLWDALSRHL